MTDELTALEIAIGRAVTSDSFADVQQLLERYVATVEQQLREFRVASDALPPLEHRTSRLLQWVHAMVLSARACDAAELSRLQLLERYRLATDSLLSLQQS